jgi:hypothetical protein
MKTPTVFISHNSKDKPFVRRLAQSLNNHNISCWIDEAEIRLGDSLVSKISSAIEDIDLIVAVISNNSVYSKWVRQELDWAMTKEIKGNRIVVIPIIIDKCDVPFFLANKLYGDFSDSSQYNSSLIKLVDSIHYHMKISPSTPETKPFGESPSLKYNPTNIPLVISSIMIGVCFCGILATHVFFRDDPNFADHRVLKKSVYVFFFMTIGAMLAEQLRIALIRYHMHRDPVFAQDAGMIHVSSLLFKQYRIFVKRHWSKLLTKAIVLIEILVSLLIVGLVSFAVKIASFL